MHKDVLAASHFEDDFGQHFISFPDFCDRICFSIEIPFKKVQVVIQVVNNKKVMAKPRETQICMETGVSVKGKKDFVFYFRLKFKYTLNSEPKALTGDKSEGIKSQDVAEALSKDLSPVKAECEEFNVLILSYTRELSRPIKENKGENTVSEEQDHQVRHQTTAARLALCARPYFSVFFPPSFVESQMAQVDRLLS